jgi:hypothetical protein
MVTEMRTQPQDNVEKWKFLILPRLEFWPLGCPAHSRSLYRLRYCDSTQVNTINYQIFWKVVWNGVHSASWVQLRSYLKEKVAAPGLESREYGDRDPSCWPRGAIYPQKLALASPTSGGRSVGIVRSRTQAFIVFWNNYFLSLTSL